MKGAACRKEGMEFLIGIGGRMGGRQAAQQPSQAFQRGVKERKRGGGRGVCLDVQGTLALLPAPPLSIQLLQAGQRLTSWKIKLRLGATLP